MSVMYNEVGSRESGASARDSLIFFCNAAGKFFICLSCRL